MRDEDAAVQAGTAPEAREAGAGATLRRAREARGLSLEQVSELLRIEPQFLIALEEERFDAIGPPVFVKGYLRHYCELLELDDRALLDACRGVLGPEEPVAQPRRSVGLERERPLGAWLAGLIAVALIAGFAWQLREPAIELAVDGAERVSSGELLEGALPPAGTEPADEPFPESAPPAAQGPSPAGADADGGAELAVLDARRLPDAPQQDASGDGARERPPQTEEGAPPSPDAPDYEPALGNAVPEEPAEPQPSSAREAAGGADPGRSPAAERDAGAADASEDALELELRFVEDSWAEVTDARDERLYYGLAPAGSQERVNADAPVTVVLGNADGVVVRVDGERYAYPPGSRRGDLARFTLAPSE